MHKRKQRRRKQRGDMILMTAQVLTQAQALIQNQEVILHRMSHRKRNETKEEKAETK